MLVGQEVGPVDQVRPFLLQELQGVRGRVLAGAGVLQRLRRLLVLLVEDAEPVGGVEDVLPAGGELGCLRLQAGQSEPPVVTCAPRWDLAGLPPLSPALG